MSSIDVSLERALRLGPPAEPAYEPRPMAFDTAAAVRPAVRRGPSLGGRPEHPPDGRAAPREAATFRTHVAWAALLVALLAIAVAGALAVQWLPSPVGNGKIAYLGFGGGYYPQSDILVVEPTGPRSPTRLTTTSDLNEGNMRWSPDGRLLAFTTSSVQPGPLRPFVMRADGQDARQLADVDCGTPAWQDNETLLCWGSEMVWQIPVAGGVPRGLRLEEWLRFADLSPDGRKLLVGLVQPVDQVEPSDEPPPAQPPATDDLYVLDTALGALRRLTDDTDTWEGQAQWSPDGTLIAFASAPSASASDSRSIEVISADGTGRRALIAASASVVVRSPTWTPDGRQLLFESLSSDEGRADGIWIMNVDGSDQRLLAEGLAIAGAVRPRFHTFGELLTQSAWSPDGQLLVVHDLQQSRRTLYTIERDGSNLTELVDCLCQFDWQPLVGR